jgi:O-antigen ligase
VCLGLIYVSLALAVLRVDWAFAGPARAIVIFPQGRLAGILASPNGLAGISVLSVAILVFRPRSRLWLVHVAACVLAVLAADARSSLLAVAVLVLLGAWLARSRSVSKTGVALLLVAMLAVPIIGIVTTSASDLETSFSNVDTFDPRRDTWDFVVDETSEYPPFLGHGVRAWDVWNEEGLSPHHFPSAHNMFFQVLATSGYAGLFFLFLTLMKCFDIGRQRYRQGDWLPLAMLTAVLLRGVTEIEADMSHFTSDSLPGWFTVVVLAAFASAQGGRSLSRRQRRRAHRRSGFAVGASERGREPGDPFHALSPR